jgi:hypothetical protein
MGANWNGIGLMQKSGAVRHASALVAMSLSFLVTIDVGCALALNPTITSCPKVIDAVEGFQINGINFPTAGQIHIHFPKAVFLPHNIFAHELTLSAQQNGWHEGFVLSNSISFTYPMGGVDDQTVNIRVSGVNGKPISDPCPAQFVGRPTILSGFPSSTTPTQLFTLTGWNFGHAGTVKVHFPTPDQNGVHDFNVPIPTPINESWKPFAIMVPMPSSITGVIGQTVDITFTRKDGLVSNSWSTTFYPTTALTNVPQQDVVVVTCSDVGQTNGCSDGSFSGHFCIGGTIDAAGIPPGDLWGTHGGCWGIGSYNGTDIYSVAVKSGWSMSEIDFVPATQYDPCCQDNGSVYPNDIAPVGMTNWPNPYTFNVPWHIGSSGGWVNYGGYFVVGGPKGVPY